METQFVEATQNVEGGLNWGKFLVGRFTREEWAYRSAMEGEENRSLIAGRGWGPQHILVLDLQTGEGAIFMPGGLASADVARHQVWVCPLFEPFLAWLYEQDLTDLTRLPAMVELAAEGALYGYRRPGSDGASE